MIKKILFSIALLFAGTLLAQTSKMVLIEEATGTWCAWCPKGKVFSNMLIHDYHDKIIFIEVHGNDPMTDEEYDDFSRFWAYPSGHVDRKSQHLQPTHWLRAFLEELRQTPPANIHVETIYDTLSRSLTTTVSADFFEDLSGDYRLAAIVVENAVTGDDESYSQKNVFANNAQGSMGGYESLPSVIPYDMMVYDHIGRHLLGGYNGAKESLPSEVKAGNTYTHSFTWTLPTEYNEEYIWVAALLINNENGQVLNANKSVYISGQEHAKPLFVSSPPANVYKDHSYVYDIRYHDPDLDFCSIEILEPIPSWLSFEEGHAGFAVLKGTPEQAGSYDVTLRLTDAEYTVDQTFQIRVSDTTIIPPVPVTTALVNDFLISPNPSDGVFTLEFDKGSRYEILDGSGKVLATGTLVRNLADQPFSKLITLEGLSKGIYFIKVFDTYGFEKTKKLLLFKD